MSGFTVPQNDPSPPQSTIFDPAQENQHGIPRTLRIPALATLILPDWSYNLTNWWRTKIEFYFDRDAKQRQNNAGEKSRGPVGDAVLRYRSIHYGPYPL
jgi:hypothetical protein